MNILVVDDEKEIADVVELYLQNDQYKVFKFYNGGCRTSVHRVCIRNEVPLTLTPIPGIRMIRNPLASVHSEGTGEGCF